MKCVSAKRLCLICSAVVKREFAKDKLERLITLSCIIQAPTDTTVPNKKMNLNADLQLT